MLKVVMIFFLCFNFALYADNSNYLGLEALYVNVVRNYTPAPEGYMPIFINHLGRHGARYLSSAENMKYIRTVLEEAEGKKQLTEKGMLLKERVEKLVELEKDNYGLLTPLGKEMEKGIARRMYENFPEVFGRTVTAVSTYVERTIESMDAFLGELAKYTPEQNLYSFSYGKIDPLLRFFDLNKAYLKYKKNGRWKEEVKIFEQRKDFSKKFLKQFFLEEYAEAVEEKERFSQALYALYVNQFDIGENLDLGEFFTEMDLEYLWENKNLSSFLEKGPGNIGENLPTNISFALLKDFLETTDYALKSKKISANLRFAHAETIIPFASILQIKGASTQTDDLEKVKEIWKDYEVSPMGANIQWIIYRGRADEELLIKMMYNEKEIEFPIPSELKPYYRWKDVRAFYDGKLKSLNLNFEENITELVENYK